MPEGTRTAGNDWINSYLEAILDVGPGLVDDAKSSLLLRERGHFSPTRYFVEEVITGFDETDLHRSWVRAAATRSPQERNTRLENLCWRIWNLARQKKQLEEKEAQRMTKRRLERERGRREATADMSEDLSEGEKGDVVTDVSTHGDSVRGRLPRINSVDAMETFISQQKGKKLYIVLISLHGLIRGENMELGRDSDTGGQVKYVVELARALGSMPGVYRVDLLTRQVSSPDVDWSYGEPTEMLTPLSAGGFEEETGESSGSYIIRIPFGPKDQYIPKENLWPHIPEFVDGALNHVIQMSKVLGEQVGGGKPVWPVAIHGHYADAGDSAALLSGALNVPMLFTGHSLGRDKLEQLLKQGRLSRDEINATYKIMRRIEAEELSLDASEIVITSTRQEIDEQWRLYDGFDPILERKIRARIRRNVSCYGRFMPRMVVIPPGMEFHHIVPLDGDMDGETDANEDHHPTPADPPIWTEIMRFFTNPRKPMILALARPDPKKNITTLVKAFGECRPLRELANLTLIMGNRDGIDDMSSTSASVLLSVLKLIDKHDLYGQVAYPKHHKQSDVPEIYRLAAKTKGVFINPAFIEPFGLTLIEAAAYGLPIVATKNGGPVDIVQVLDNGLLVDPHDQQSIADALLKLVADKHLWARCRQNGLKNIHLYSWPEHCKTYLSRIASCKARHPQWQRSDDGAESSESDSPSDSLRDIQDLSLNLKFSMDGEKSGISVNESSLESEGSIDRKNKIESAVLAWSKGISRDTRKAGFSEKADHNSSGKFPVLRRRKHLIVICVDCDTITDLIDTTKKIFEATEKLGFVSVGAKTMADEAQYSSGPDSGSNKRKYEEPTTRRVTGFSAPILPSSSPDSVPTSYSSVPPPVDDIQLAKQRAQEIAARLYNNASSGVAAAGGLETKRPRVDNGGGYDSGDRGFSSIPSDAKPYSAPSSIPVSYGFQGGSKKIAVPNGRVGVIIGKQGETIKYLQAQSGGAKIQVTRDADADLNCPTREVEIMGTPEQISKAEHLINEVLAEAESGGPAVVSRRSTGQAGAETFVMKIPNNKVGLVIGKRGETIKNMQASTAARIQVIPLHLPPGDTSIERTVQIDGTSEQIEAAKQLVNEVISENRARNPGMGGGYSQQGYQARPPTGWAPSGPPMQQPGYGYGQSGAYSGATPQYNASQPSYPGYPPQPASGGYPTNWDQSAAAPTQQTSQGGSYDYYSQQPSHQQQNPGGSAAPADNASYNYGQPPISGYNQQGQGYSQDGYGGYQAPPQSGYGQPPAYDQHGYPAANYSNVSNPAPDTSSYGSQGESAQAPPVQPAPGGQQAYTANQQPSPNPASYPPQVPSQPGYGMPPTSQTGYGTQPPAQSAYGPGYGAPPQAQKPPAQSPTTPGSYGQPPAVHPGYPHSQPPPSGYAQPDSGARVPPSSYGSTAAQAGYGGPPAYGAPPSGQPGYGQAPPYNTSYGTAGYTQPPAYSAEGANGNTRGGAYDAAGAGAPASQTAQPSGVAKTSPQS